MKLNSDIKIFDKIFGVPLSQKIFFVQHLGVMIKAGIPLFEALKTLSQQTEHHTFQRIILDVASSVESGGALADALVRHPKVFNDFFVNMVRSGEISGRLDAIMEEIYEQMRKDHELMSRVKTALTYPAVVLFVMLVVGIVVITQVIPKITSIFDEVEATLPLATRMVIGLSDLFLEKGYLVLVAIAILSIIFYYIHKSKRGRYLIHSALLKTPVFGKIIHKVNIARFSRSLNALLRTDISLIQALDITSGTLGNYVYRQTLLESIPEVEHGVSLSESLKTSPHLFPPIVTQMVYVGEKTGALDNMLGELATFYEEDVAQTMERLPSLVEPILILILGIAVAIIAMAVMLPLYSLTQQF